MALAEVPAERVFFSQRPVFEFIEQRLPPGSTLVIPPDSARGRQVVTDAALRVAFAGVLDEFLAALLLAGAGTGGERFLFSYYPNVKFIENFSKYII